MAFIIQKEAEKSALLINVALRLIQDMQNLKTEKKKKVFRYRNEGWKSITSFTLFQLRYPHFQTCKSYEETVRVRKTLKILKIILIRDKKGEESRASGNLPQG